MKQQSSRGLLTEDEAARVLGISSRTLEAWRYRGGGPRFVSKGRRFVRYRPVDLDKWMEDHLRTSTSDPGGEAA